MLKVVLTPSFFIILAELALHTVSLLGQLVFCTYALFEIPKFNYECGVVVRVLDSGSDVRGLSPIIDDIFFRARFFVFQLKYS